MLWDKVGGQGWRHDFPFHNCVTNIFIFWIAVKPKCVTNIMISVKPGKGPFLCLSNYNYFVWVVITIKLSSNGNNYLYLSLSSGKYFINRRRDWGANIWLERKMDGRERESASWILWKDLLVNHARLPDVFFQSAILQRVYETRGRYRLPPHKPYSKPYNKCFLIQNIVEHLCPLYLNPRLPCAEPRFRTSTKLCFLACIESFLGHLQSMTNPQT